MNNFRGIRECGERHMPCLDANLSYLIFSTSLGNNESRDNRVSTSPTRELSLVRYNSLPGYRCILEHPREERNKYKYGGTVRIRPLCFVFDSDLH